MPRSIHVHDGAAWRKAKGIWVHDGVAWRKAKGFSAHDGAAWRLSGASAPANFAPGTISSSRFGAIEAVVWASFGTDGTITLYSDTEGTRYAAWFESPEAGAGNAYWIRATLQSGLAPSFGQSLGGWLPLSSARDWGYSSGTSGYTSGRSGTLLFQIAADAGGTNIVCSGQIGFSTFRES